MMASTSVLQTDFAFTGYGKNYVKLLILRRDGNVHHVKEMEVSTELTLNNTKDYLHGDNSDIVATDSQKNTVYIMARQHGIMSPERFAMVLCEHFLRKYHHVLKARVYIEEAPWKRIEVGGRQHVHAYMFSQEAMRCCEVQQEKNGKPLVQSGLKDMRVMKTTQSAFKHFVNDEYRTLPDADDRLFCTVVQSSWWYNSTDIDFDKAWESVKTTILETFAGPADKGVFSPSVQNTLYLAERNVLSKIPQIEKIEMVLPNVHYYGVDFKRFPNVNFNQNKNEVFQPTDKPSGNIKASIQRRPSSKL